MSPGQTNYDKHSGFGLLEAVISTAVMATVGLGIASMWVNSSQQQARLEFSSSMLQLKQQLSTAVSDPSAWAMTVQMAPTGAANSLSCLSSGGCSAATTYAPFTLYNADGSIADDSVSPSTGFTNNGAPCTGYDPAGSNVCPVRVELDWKALCNLTFDPHCTQPQIMIQASFQYSPGLPNTMKYAFNMSKFSFNMTRSAFFNVASNTSTSTTAATMAQVCTYLGGSVGGSGACTLPNTGGVDIQINGLGNTINMTGTVIAPSGSIAAVNVGGLGQSIAMSGLTVSP